MMTYAIDDLNETVGGANPDPIVVNALVEAMHHNLYTVINSAAMNGVGENTVIRKTTPAILNLVKIITCVIAVLLIFFAAFWIVGSKKMKKTAEYRAYKEARLAYKASKK